MSSISIQLRVEIQFAVLLTVTEVKKLRKDIALTKSSSVGDTHLLKLTNIWRTFISNIASRLEGGNLKTSR